MTENFPVTASYYLGGDKAVAYFEGGQTIAEVLGEYCSQTVTVRVGGIVIPREMWGRCARVLDCPWCAVRKAGGLYPAPIHRLR